MVRTIAFTLAVMASIDIMLHGGTTVAAIQRLVGSILLNIW